MNSGTTASLDSGTRWTGTLTEDPGLTAQAVDSNTIIADACADGSGTAGARNTIGDATNLDVPTTGALEMSV